MFVSSTPPHLLIALTLFEFSEEVVPCFYDRDDAGLPRQWLQKVRRAITTLTAQYTTWRMVQDYARKYYLPGA